MFLIIAIPSKFAITEHAPEQADGQRVEPKVAINLVRDLPNDPPSGLRSISSTFTRRSTNPASRAFTFADLAHHYLEHELGDQTKAVDPKSHTTIGTYKRILKNRCLARWGKRPALGIQPLEVEQWPKSLKKKGGLENSTLDKTRRVMTLVFKHGQRYRLIPRTKEANPMRFVRCKTTSSYEARILTPEQAFDLLIRIEEPERTLTLLAASSGRRISERLGLEWQDVDFDAQRFTSAGRGPAGKSVSQRAGHSKPLFRCIHSSRSSC